MNEGLALFITAAVGAILIGAGFNLFLSKWVKHQKEKKVNRHGCCH